MGMRLFNEMLRDAPADLTTAERLVLLVLAANARDETRECWPGTDWLTHVTGISDSGVRYAIGRLAARGYEVRVPISKTKAGKPIFAVRGRRTTYRLPVFPQRHIAVNMVTPITPDSREQTHGYEAEWREHSNKMAGTRSRPNSHVLSKQQQRFTDEQQKAIVEKIRQDRPDASAALIRHIVKEDGAEILADLDKAEAARTASADLAAKKTMSECPHGTPGGEQLHPISGEPLCALCRAASRRSA